MLKYSSGGSEIVKECQDFVKKYGKLNEGDVFMSSGGDLPARFIAHVSSPQWRNGQRKETEVLKEAVFKAMQQATIRNANSIAIPALGCGNYGFPLKTATEIIVTAVKDFFREVQESKIMKVYLVDVKPMTVEAFTDAMKDAFASVHPVAQDVGHQNSDDEDEGYIQKPVPQPRRKPVSSGNLTFSIIVANKVDPHEAAYDKQCHLDLVCCPSACEFSVLYSLKETFF